MSKEMKKNIVFVTIVVILIAIILTGISILFLTKPKYSLKENNPMPETIETSSLEFSYQQNELMLENMLTDNASNPSKYLEFNLNGTNKTKEEFSCEVNLILGSNHETKEIRIKDNFLKFKLVELSNNQEKVIFTDRVYKDLNNTTILKEIVEANETIDSSYKLYMYLSDDVKIGTSNNSDYSVNEIKNDVYASIKIIPKCGFNN